MIQFLIVGLGGAIGAMSRYGLGTIAIKMDFPLTTFLINFVGAVIIGLFAGLTMSRDDISPNTALFVKVGICGGFTTFSGFSLEVMNMFEDNHAILAIVYAIVSVVTCVIGVWLGRKFVLG